MAEVIFLEETEGPATLKLLTEVGVVWWGGKEVLEAAEEGDRELADIGEVVERWVFLPIFLQVFCRAVIVFLKLFCYQNLSEVV